MLAYNYIRGQTLTDKPKNRENTADD